MSEQGEPKPVHAIESVLRSPLLRRLTRTQAVWGALVVAMTGVGALLMLLEDRRAGARPPLALVSLTQAPGRSVETIFQTRSPIEPGRWKGVVIHHSGAPMGSPESITEEHNDRGFRGLGYHFVISNGQGAPDGQIFVGYRWQDQLPGVHVVGPLAEQFNRETVGVCLVGDGERRGFTDAQLASLAQLVGALEGRLALPAGAVQLNRDVAPTSGPGRHFPEAAFRELIASGR